MNMNKSEMIQINTSLLSRKLSTHEKAREPIRQLTEQIKVVKTRSELNIDYTGMVGYKICGRSDGQVLVYLPVLKMHGLVVSLPFENIKPLEVQSSGGYVVHLSPTKEQLNKFASTNLILMSGLLPGRKD